MTLLTIAIPVALLVAAAALIAFIWAARTDQFEALDTPPRRMLLEDAPVAGASPAMPDVRAPSALPQALPCTHGSDRVSSTSPSQLPS
jgi:cbb3-type cytochrome oxidase maturation protein